MCPQGIAISLQGAFVIAIEDAFLHSPCHRLQGIGGNGIIILEACLQFSIRFSLLDGIQVDHPLNNQVFIFKTEVKEFVLCSSCSLLIIFDVLTNGF